ncbi:MAG: hypothetical protein WBF33_23610 [Candidatus Nitrosopolaris sp.]
MVTFSQNHEVSAGELIIDRRCDIFADELTKLWKVLGRRWTLSILKSLDVKEAIRFNELKRLIPGSISAYTHSLYYRCIYTYYVELQPSITSMVCAIIGDRT